MTNHTYQNRDGVRRTVIIDPDRPYSPIVHTEQDIEPILEGIARDRDNMRHGVNKVVARIPITIYERSIHEDWDEGDWKRWLNSTEAAPFRIWGGRV